MSRAFPEHSVHSMPPTREPSAPGCLPPVPCGHSHAARPWPQRGLSPPLRLLVLPPPPRPCHRAATPPTCLQKPRGYGVEVGFLPPSPTPCPSPAPHRCHCQPPMTPPPRPAHPRPSSHSGPPREHPGSSVPLLPPPRSLPRLLLIPHPLQGEGHPPASSDFWPPAAGRWPHHGHLRSPV